MLVSNNINYQINLNSSLFKDCVVKLSSKVEEIIETGTFNGLGSTTVFAETGKRVHSIESSLSHYNLAKENLKKYSNVNLHWGSSLNIKEMQSFIENDEIYDSDLVFNKKINVDGNTDPKNFYLNEIHGFGIMPKKEDLLLPLINNKTKQLVFLDSAGGVGFLEFEKFMSLKEDIRKFKILLLDDISHVKHYRSVVYLKLNKFNVNISEDKRFAYCIFDENIF